jgi:hypothetical protein
MRLLMVWDINPTAWLASAGVIGIAVGFAARDTLANLFAGFFIIADAPYKLGDYIVLDSGDRGEVTKVGIRSTRLLTRDDVEITVPNAEMANAKIFNESGGRWIKFRIRLKVGVAYGSDVDQVVELLEQITAEHDNVCRDPSPRVRMRGFGDSSLDFELLCWVNHPSERGLVTHELYMHIYKALNENGIEIPFPQRDVWVRDTGMPKEGGARRSDGRRKRSADSENQGTTEDAEDTEKASFGDFGVFGGSDFLRAFGPQWPVRKATASSIGSSLFSPPRRRYSTTPLSRPRSPMTRACGMPISSASANITPGRWLRSSISTSLPAARSSA